MSSFKFRPTFLLSVLIINLFLRLVTIQSPSQPILTEKYFFVPAAKNILHNLNDYVNDKPPLGKYIIATGVLVFGDNPIGWRSTPILFGLIAVWLSYNFTKRVFKKEVAARFAAMLITFDTSWFYHSRTADVEIFFVVLVSTAFYFLWKFTSSKKNGSMLLSGILFGLASSVKWMSPPAMLFGFISMLFIVKKAVWQKLFYSLIISTLAIIVYFATFVPFLFNSSPKKIAEFHIWVWQFYTSYLPKNVERLGPKYLPKYNEVKVYFEHPALWILNPQLLVYHEPQNGHSKSVILQYNPIIFWAGLVSIFYTLIKKRESKELGFLLAIFLSSYLPWFIIPRYALPYYILYGTFAMILILSYYLEKIWASNRLIAIIFSTMAITTFFLYYPLLTAINVPDWYFHLLTHF